MNYSLWSPLEDFLKLCSALLWLVTPLLYSLLSPGGKEAFFFSLFFCFSFSFSALIAQGTGGSILCFPSNIFSANKLPKDNFLSRIAGSMKHGCGVELCPSPGSDEWK